MKTKTKQIIKKAICFMISALLLSTSLPMQVLAQSVNEEIPSHVKAVLESAERNDIWGKRDRLIKEHWESTEALDYGDLVRQDAIDHAYLENRRKLGGSFFDLVVDDAKGSHLLIVKEDATGKIVFHRKGNLGIKRDIALTQDEIRSILNEPKLVKELFGEVDTYAKFARVQAVQAKGGEEIVTVLADGTKETKNIAKAGDWIVTNPGGEQYIVPEAKFAKKYEKAADLGDGWYKPTGGAADFRQIKQDMKMLAPWGEEQVLKKGAYINVTDINDLYGVAEAEFNDTYKSIKVLYRENFNGIKRFVSKIEERLYKRYPKYKGVFFRKFLKNDVKYMERRLEQKAARKAALKRITSRAFTGTLVGMGLYIGLTAINAPTVKAQNVKGKTHNQVISELEAEVNANAEKKNLFEKMRSFANENYSAVVITDAIEGDGKLLDEMSSASVAANEMSNILDEEATLTERQQEEGLTGIIDEMALGEGYKIPSYDPLKGIKVEGIPGNVSFD